MNSPLSRLHGIAKSQARGIEVRITPELSPVEQEYLREITKTERKLELSRLSEKVRLASVRYCLHILERNQVFDAISEREKEEQRRDNGQVLYLGGTTPLAEKVSIELLKSSFDILKKLYHPGNTLEVWETLEKQNAKLIYQMIMIMPVYRIATNAIIMPEYEQNIPDNVREYEAELIDMMAQMKGDKKINQKALDRIQEIGEDCKNQYGHAKTPEEQQGLQMIIESCTLWYE